MKLLVEKEEREGLRALLGTAWRVGTWGAEVVTIASFDARSRERGRNFFLSLAMEASRVGMRWDSYTVLMGGVSDELRPR